MMLKVFPVTARSSSPSCSDKAVSHTAEPERGASCSFLKRTILQRYCELHLLGGSMVLLRVSVWHPLFYLHFSPHFDTVLVPLSPLSLAHDQSCFWLRVHVEDKGTGGRGGGGGDVSGWGGEDGQEVREEKSGKGRDGERVESPVMPEHSVLVITYD